MKSVLKNIFMWFAAILGFTVILFATYYLLDFSSKIFVNKAVNNYVETKNYITAKPLIIDTNKEARMRRSYEAEINIIGSENTEPIIFEGLIVEITISEDGTLKIISTDSIRKYYENDIVKGEWFNE